MKSRFGVILTMAFLGMSSLSAGKEKIVSVKEAAPEFSLSDENGKTVKLSDFEGKKRVLIFSRAHW